MKRPRFGQDRIHPDFMVIDQHEGQYGSVRAAARYHRWVLRQAVRMADLRPGMSVLDYGCGEQELRTVLPPGVVYTGYDAVPGLSDLDDPREDSWDCIFAIQMMMYLDGAGLEQWTDTFCSRVNRAVIMVPTRNWLKDEVLDRLLGLHGARDRLVRSTPDEVAAALSRDFDCSARRSLLGMGLLTRWEPTEMPDR